MKYGIIILSLILGYVGLVFDVILFSDGPVLFSFIFFLAPTMYCVGEIWTILTKQEKERKEAKVEDHR